MNAALIVMSLVLLVPELVLWLSEAGLFGSPHWRLRAFQYGAFWTGLLDNWLPNYALQPVSMFVTYSVLHAGPAHLLGNLGGIVWFGPRLFEETGLRGLAVIWLAAVLGGAVGFALLAARGASMVGASGAVFGLAGAWIVLGWRERSGRSPAEAWRWVGLMSLLLAAVNLVGFVLESGALAWQAHLGGAMAGALAALLLGRERRDGGSTAVDVPPRARR